MKDIYTVFDKKTSSYGNLMLSSHIGEMTRSLERALADAESAIAKWPSDFALCRVGQYDQAKGVITPVTPPEVVLEVAALVRPKLNNINNGANP